MFNRSKRASSEVALEARVAARPLWQDHDLVFPNGVGEPFDPADLNHEFHELLTAAKLPTRRLHDLRHGAGSLLAVLGVHPRVATTILGHSAMSLTTQVYTHVPDTLKQAAATKLDGLLGTPGGAAGPS